MVYIRCRLTVAAYSIYSRTARTHTIIPQNNMTYTPRAVHTTCSDTVAIATAAHSTPLFSFFILHSLTSPEAHHLRKAFVRGSCRPPAATSHQALRFCYCRWVWEPASAEFQGSCRNFCCLLTLAGLSQGYSWVVGQPLWVRRRPPCG